jgi:hypothetical protein
LPDLRAGGPGISSASITFTSGLKNKNLLGL